MHRRVIKSLLPLMGAAALVVAPIVVAAPASASGISAAVITPDDTWEFDEDYNQPEFWESFLAEDADVDAWCAKDDTIDKPYTIPSIEDVFELEEGESYDDFAYVLAVLKGGADEYANELYWDPSAGDQLSHSNAGNSHVILCIAQLEDDASPSPTTTKPPTTKPPTTKPPTTKPATGPVVETDRVADSGSSANLGLAAVAAALIAGVGGIFVSRRRQGSHR